ncbi:hypothetical protein Scani_44700 [Streptomyces caniferus]|uniref:Uncharacterized protein n=1 Tax=Streptomyces caniferus TaxID=285557 RepID=A0A640SCL5_9ACTN|nr:hypothetical protein [Streptomyces caniferus]GFE08202.1 hypothetical protein Scani_44700 [Streptomyces caniferus]
MELAALCLAVEQVALGSAVLGAGATVVRLVPQDDDSAEVAMRVVLVNRNNTMKLGSVTAGRVDGALRRRRVGVGVRRLSALVRRKAGVTPLLPREVGDQRVPPA